MHKKLKKFLRRFRSNVYVKAATVGCAMFISDFFWAKYISTVAATSALSAANYSVAVVLLGTYVVISYVEDKRMIVPTIVGAWLGTYCGI